MKLEDKEAYELLGIIREIIERTKSTGSMCHICQYDEILCPDNDAEYMCETCEREQSNFKLSEML